MTTPTTTMTSLQLDSDDEILAVAAVQRRELAAALSSDSDLDLAFHLQLQEAINASLSLSSATSSLTTSSSSQPNNIATSSSSEPDVATSASLSSPLLAHAEYLDAVMLEQSDRHMALSQSRHVADDLLMRSHDRHVAEEINRMSEGEWEETGDEFHIPFGQGHSSRDEGSNGLDIDFRVYCKGLVSGEGVMGVGVAVCDLAGNVVFEMRKPVVGVGKGRLVAELKAVIEGLGVAGDLGLKGVIFCFDHYPVYQYLVGRWTPKQRKIFPLVNHVNQLRGKFEFSTPSLVIGNDMKFAFKLAREAIASHLNRPSESGSVKNINESCAICLDDKDVGQFFTVDSCSHRYCFSCMKQHVEVKLLHGMTARCPHEGCDSELKIENCKIFLTPKLIEMMTHRLKEASIPVAEKVYCPYPKCSYLMTKTDVLKYSGKSVISGFSARKCIKCNDFFCIYCKVPWHYNMSCDNYKMKNPYPPTEDAKLKMLANKNFWRQCVKCNHMIELDTGCYHMTCRCGYEFCYTCGAEWKNKKATCCCPLWDVDNILDQDYEFHEELHDDDDDDWY